MARYRVNPNAICSSKNYKQSKKLHMDMLKRNHEVFMEMVIKEGRNSYQEIGIYYCNKS